VIETDVLAFVNPVRSASNLLDPPLSAVDIDPTPFCKSMLQCPLRVAEAEAVVTEAGPLTPPTLKYVEPDIETPLNVMKMNL
jgi:hypothetical protein